MGLNDNIGGAGPLVVLGGAAALGIYGLYKRKFWPFLVVGAAYAAWQWKIRSDAKSITQP